MSRIIAFELDTHEYPTGEFFVGLAAAWPYDYAIIRPLWITRDPALPERYQRAFQRERIPVAMSKDELLAISDKIVQVLECQAVFGRRGSKDKIYLDVDDAGATHIAFRDSSVTNSLIRFLELLE